MIIYKIEQAGTGHVYAKKVAHPLHFPRAWEGHTLYPVLYVRSHNIGKYCVAVVL